MADPAVFGRPVIVTANDFRFIVAEQLLEIGIEADIILEPARRDSAAAVAVAAEFVARRDPAGGGAGDGRRPCGRLSPRPSSRPAPRRPARRAQGLIMTLGITPDSPATGYGYIRPGLPVEGGQGATQVERFVEKPDAATAARYIAEGYLWNSGNFLFQAGVMREELEAFAPEVLAAARGRAGRRRRATSISSG